MSALPLANGRIVVGPMTLLQQIAEDLADPLHVGVDAAQVGGLQAPLRLQVIDRAVQQLEPIPGHPSNGPLRGDIAERVKNGVVGIADGTPQDRLARPRRFPLHARKRADRGPDRA